MSTMENDRLSITGWCGEVIFNTEPYAHIKLNITFILINRNIWK